MQVLQIIGGKLIPSSYDKDGDGYLNATEIKYVSTLKIGSDSGISSLNNLYQYTGLKNLTLEGVTLSSLDGIDTVGGLSYLYLKNVNCSNYSAISSCTNLITLYVERNGNTKEIDNDQVNKLLVAMKESDYEKLDYFGIFGNTTPLTNSTDFIPDETSLKSQLTNISAIGEWSSKTKLAIDYLYLNSNQIDDFSAISGFTNLQELHLQGNPFSTLSFISGMNSLKNIYLNSSGVSDISVFNTFSSTNLKSIIAYSCANLVDCTPLKKLSSLGTIYLLNSSNLSTAKVEEIADWYNARGAKNIDDKYLDYLQGSTKRVYISKGLTDNSDAIKNMMDMSAEDKLKIKKISLYGNSSLSNARIVSLLSGKDTNNNQKGYFTNCVALNLQGLSNLTSLDFLQYMPNLVEIILTGTGIQTTEVSKLDTYSTKLYRVALDNNNSNIDLTKMQKTISRCTATSAQSAWTDSYYGGFSCGANLATKLPDCTNLTYFSAYQFRYAGTIDLSRTSITGLSGFGNCKFILPASCTYFSTQWGVLADTSNCKQLANVIINQGYSGNLESFIKGLKNNETYFYFQLTPTSKGSYPELNYLSETKVSEIKIFNNGNFTFDNLGIDFSKNTDGVSETCFNDLTKITIYNVTGETATNLDFLSGCKNLEYIDIKRLD